MGERRHAGRLKSFLRGFVYFDKRRGALSCLVRDLSDEGARIIFSEIVTMPDDVDLHIPQKDQTLRAKVTWRRGDEIGLGFPAADAATASSADAAELMKRIAQLEGEIAALRKMLKRMKGDAAARRRRRRGVSSSPAPATSEPASQPHCAATPGVPTKAPRACKSGLARARFARTKQGDDNGQGLLGRDVFFRFQSGRAGEYAKLAGPAIPPAAAASSPAAPPPRPTRRG